MTALPSNDTEPSRAAWLEVCAELQSLHEHTPEETPQAVSAIESHCQGWPARFRMAPLHWILDLIHQKLPVDVLGICSSLSLAPACHGHFAAENKANYDALTEWVSQLGADCPAMAGLHLGLAADGRRPVEDALGSQVPACELWDCHYEEDLIEAILSSPLAASLRVLDLSLDPPNDAALSQDTLNGRGLSLGEITKWLSAPERLEVLDLHGQYTECGDYARCARLPALASLTALDVGGGHPFNTRDTRKLAKQMAKSSLMHLNLAAGPAIEFVGYDDDDVDPMGLEYFNIMNVKDLETSGKTLELLVKEVPTLERLVLSQKSEETLDFAALKAKTSGDIQFAPSYAPRVTSLGSNWSQHYEF